MFWSSGIVTCGVHWFPVANTRAHARVPTRRLQRKGSELTFDWNETPSQWCSSEKVLLNDLLFKWTQCNIVSLWTRFHTSTKPQPTPWRRRVHHCHYNALSWETVEACIAYGVKSDRSQKYVLYMSFTWMTVYWYWMQQDTAVMVDSSGSSALSVVSTFYF